MKANFIFLVAFLALSGLIFGRSVAAPPTCIGQSALEQALLQTIQAQHYELTPDYGQNGGNPIQEPPSVDVAVIAFQEGCQPAYANVLLSRDLPQGHIAQIDPQTLEVQGLQWKKDQNGLWDKGANWNNFNLQDLVSGTNGTRYPVPYPASLLKLMTAVKIIQLIDQGDIHLSDNYTYLNGPTKTIEQWLDEMITISSNEATFAMLKLLHDRGEIVAVVPPAQRRLPCSQQTERTETVNSTNELFVSLGLDTLQMSRTRGCDGSFYNSAGSGVGWHHMTAWDTARLLWLLDTAAPTPVWLVNGLPVNTAFMSQTAKDLLVNRFLGQQGFHEVLSTTATCGTPGRAEGIPADLPDRWIAPDGSVTIDGVHLSDDARPCDAAAEVTFAHKTGLTENYGSDAGIVRSFEMGGRHYIISFISNLGYRYVNTCFTTNLCYTQKIPAMALAIDNFLENVQLLPTPTPTGQPTLTPTPPPAGDTGYQSPTANNPATGGDNNGFEQTPTNGYSDDGLFALDNNSGTSTSTNCANSRKDRHIFYNYGLTVPAGVTITGIEIRLDAKTDSPANNPTLCLQLSWDGGNSWSATKITPTLSQNEQSYLLGGPTTNWGWNWTAAHLTNSNFRVRITSLASSTARDFWLDWVAVKVFYQ